MTTLFDQAKLMARELQDSDEYKQLRAALAKVKADQASNEAFSEFQKAQREIQELQSKGQEPNPDQISRWQTTAKQAQQLEPIKALSVIEQNLNSTLSEVNEIITAPLNELYLQK
ncbi:hypothetical protein OAL24_00291 [Oenococcus sicerae]|nr:hypothetical protein OAL24_00291 [Oenococcus sicerae]